MVALTGEAASDAHTRGQEIAGSVNAAQPLHGDALADAIRGVNEVLDQAQISAALKMKLRGDVSELEKRLFQERKAEKEERKANFSAEIGEIAAKAADQGKPFLVYNAEVDGDVNAIKSGIDAVRAVAADMGVFFFSVNEAKGQITAIADTPQAVMDRGLNAKEWAAAALQACGGKGGGRPNQAQGKSKEVERLPEGIAVAEKFAAEKLGL